MRTSRTSAQGCRPGGCALLCTEAGLAAAHAEHLALVTARARRVVVDPHLAEEAAQETFTRAWRACHTFDPSAGPLGSWLAVIATNVAIDLARARARRPPVASDELADQTAERSASGIDRILHRAELRDALARISEDHRRAVLETIVLDRPHQDVARELGINVATLRTRVHYGLRRLRAVMATPA